MLGELLDLVFPARCAGCGEVGAAVCDGCRLRLRPAPPLGAPVGVDRLVAAFEYEGVARELVARVKYRNERAGVGLLADAVVRSLGQAGIGRPTVVTWVPTTAERRRSRGFDHAALLARAVARGLHVPARGLLVRVGGPPQTGRPAAQRRAGPQFAARLPAGEGTVLLVDDVVTTGATLRAAARALRSAGAPAVVAAVAARTP
ncbi:MAG: phosphoribosyltransferase family protein [Acidimicrobiia bacterium]